MRVSIYLEVIIPAEGDLSIKGKGESGRSMG